MAASKHAKGRSKAHLMKRYLRYFKGSTAKWVIEWNPETRLFGKTKNGIRVTHKHQPSTHQAQIVWRDLGDELFHKLQLNYLVKVAVCCQYDDKEFYFEEAEFDVEIKFKDIEDFLRNDILPMLYKRVNYKHYMGMVAFEVSVIK